MFGDTGSLFMLWLYYNFVKFFSIFTTKEEHFYEFYINFYYFGHLSFLEQWYSLKLKYKLLNEVYFCWSWQSESELTTSFLDVQY